MRILPLALLITMFVLGGSANADPLPKRVLIVLTNTARVPGSDRPTGVWASEYTDPYQVFSKAGFEVHVGSPNGGKSPVAARVSTQVVWMSVRFRECANFPSPESPQWATRSISVKPGTVTSHRSVRSGM